MLLKIKFCGIKTKFLSIFIFYEIYNLIIYSFIKNNLLKFLLKLNNNIFNIN